MSILASRCIPWTVICVLHGERGHIACGDRVGFRPLSHLVAGLSRGKVSRPLWRDPAAVHSRVRRVEAQRTRRHGCSTVDSSRVCGAPSREAPQGAVAPQAATGPGSHSTGRHDMQDWYAKKTLGTLVDEAAGRWSAREALTYEGQRWSFAQLQTEVNRTARALLALGIQAGERVALWMPCLLYTSPSPRDRQKSRMPSSA